jgi:hypothetical protein
MYIDFDIFGVDTDCVILNWLATVFIFIHK